MTEQLEHKVPVSHISASNGHAEEGALSATQSLVSKSESLPYQPRTVLNRRETVLFEHLVAKGEEGSDRFELAELFPGDWTMGPRVVENVAAMAGHIAKYYQENMPKEFQGLTVRHSEGGRYKVFPLDDQSQE